MLLKVEICGAVRVGNRRTTICASGVLPHVGGNVPFERKAGIPRASEARLDS